MSLCSIQGKIKYATMVAAEQSMYDIYRRSGEEIFGSYKCSGCDAWHLTSMYDNRSLGCKNRFEKLTKKSTSNKKHNVLLPKDEQARAFAELKKIQSKRSYRVWYNLKRYARRNIRIVLWVAAIEFILRVFGW